MKAPEIAKQAKELKAEIEEIEEELAEKKAALAMVQSLCKHENKTAGDWLSSTCRDCLKTIYSCDDH